MKYIYCFIIGILLYLLLNGNESFRKLEKFTISAPVEAVVPDLTVKLEPSGGIVDHDSDTCLGPRCPQKYDVALDASDVPSPGVLGSDVPSPGVPGSGGTIKTRNPSQLEGYLIRGGLEDIAGIIGNDLYNLGIKNLSDIPELLEELPGPDTASTAGTAAAGIQEPRGGPNADKISELYLKLSDRQQKKLRSFLQMHRSELERDLIRGGLEDIAGIIGNDLYNLDIKNLSDIPELYEELPAAGGKGTLGIQEARGGPKADKISELYKKLSRRQQKKLRSFLLGEIKKLPVQKPVADYTQLDNTLVMGNLKDIVDRFYEVSESDKSIKNLSELDINNLHDLIAFRHHNWKEETDPIKLNQRKEFLILYNSLDEGQKKRLKDKLDIYKDYKF